MARYPGTWACRANQHASQPGKAQTISQSAWCLQGTCRKSMMPKKQMAGSGVPPARGSASTLSATPGGACAPRPSAGSPVPGAARVRARVVDERCLCAPALCWLPFACGSTCKATNIP